MKIPFFYLQVGRLTIFQPQNKNKHIHVTTDDYSIKIHASHNPGLDCYYSTINIYINGESGVDDFKICKTKKDITEAIEFLKTIEVDNV